MKKIVLVRFEIYIIKIKKDQSSLYIEYIFFNEQTNKTIDKYIQV